MIFGVDIKPIATVITLLSILVTVVTWIRAARINRPVFGNKSLSVTETKIALQKVIAQILADRDGKRFEPDLIIGLNSVGFGGGALVADVIGAALGLPVALVNVDIRKPPYTAELSCSDSLLASKCLLLVDDILNTGRSMSLAQETLQQRFPSARIQIAVLMKIEPKQSGVPPVVKANYFHFVRDQLTYERDLIQTSG